MDNSFNTNIDSIVKFNIESSQKNIDFNSSKMENSKHNIYSITPRKDKSPIIEKMNKTMNLNSLN